MCGGGSPRKLEQCDTNDTPIAVTNIYKIGITIERSVGITIEGSVWVRLSMVLYFGYTGAYGTGVCTVAFPFSLLMKKKNELLEKWAFSCMDGPPPP